MRWTLDADSNAELTHVVEKLAQITGHALNVDTFKLEEERDLAFNHYRRYSQQSAGLPIKGMGIRLWTDKNGDLVQVEAQIEKPSLTLASRDLSRIGASARDESGRILSSNLLSASRTAALVHQIVNAAEDHTIRGMRWNDMWVKGKLVREVRVRAGHGTHIITIGLASRKVESARYQEFPQVDPQETALPAKVFPIYEEFAGQILDRTDVVLEGIKSRIPRPDSDPFEPMRDRRYFYSKYDPVLGETEEGRKQGYWAESYLKRQAAGLVGALPLRNNDFESGGMLLQGDYVTINLHPQAYVKWPKIEFPAQVAANYLPRWVETQNPAGEPDYEIIPGAAYLGKPLFAAEDAYNRDATRHPTHDPLTYINAGFDEVQVYYAVNRMFQALKTKGFTDPDLSTRPFHAFLYDPDVAYRDNAYYTSDTINFTTYSPKEPNAARDNTTIWHELGHGVMDRLMGDQITLADTGGLSEGMADFVAALVIRDVTEGASFPGDEAMRIINRTGFYLTNEVHDDGEAYGGTMNDMLTTALERWGQEGLRKMTDLTLEAMRLTRDHPALTADDWFTHMRFADRLGREGVRDPYEMADIIDGALRSRNFAAAVADRATFALSYKGESIDAGKPGSRGNEIPLSIHATETADYELVTAVQSSENFKYKFPVEVRVYLQTGPLQGAIHWENEELTYISYTIGEEGKDLHIPLRVSGTCDFINREDGSCSDFVYVQIWNDGEKAPVAKKRFYVRLKTLEDENSVVK